VRNFAIGMVGRIGAATHRLAIELSGLRYR
jgi:hypothetical protein